MRSLWPWVGGGGVLVFVTMGLAILPFARRSVLELRSLAARPTRLSVWQRYYVDLFLVVLAANRPADGAAPTVRLKCRVNALWS